jgi:hypothetical protein
VQLSRAYGRPWILIMSEIAVEDAMVLRDVLRHNMHLAIGAVALEDGFLVVRHLLPLDDLTWPVLERVMEVVAGAAARLRRGQRPASVANIYAP